MATREGIEVATGATATVTVDLKVAPVEATIQSVPQLPQSAPRQPAIVCGLTIVLGDPTIDRNVRARLPDTGVKPTIRTVVPEVCRSDNAVRPPATRRRQ